MDDKENTAIMDVKQLEDFLKADDKKGPACVPTQCIKNTQCNELS